MSGLSGILAGTYALMSVAVVYWLVTTYSNGILILDGQIFRLVILILALVSLLSIVTGVILTTQKAKKRS